MACETGQEAHLADLAARFDRYVVHLREQFGEMGDLRLTVMAAIMVMDELSDAEQKIAGMRSQLDLLRESHDKLAEKSDHMDRLFSATLEDMTGQIITLTAKLNGAQAQTSTTPGLANDDIET